MKFGGVFKKGPKKTFKEDLAVSDPGSDDSWDLLYNKVAKDGSAQEQPPTRLPQNNSANVPTASRPPAVSSYPAIPIQKDKKEIKSTEKNSSVPNGVQRNLITPSACKKTKQNLSHRNSQSEVPVTSTPFLREKRIPCFEVSPIVSSGAQPAGHDGCQEDVSPLIESTPSLHVNRKKPSRHADAFDLLLHPGNKGAKAEGSILPGIVPLVSNQNQADTTRQYAGGIIRGVKMYQEQFSDFVSTTESDELKKLNSITQTANSKSIDTRKSQSNETVIATVQNKTKEDTTMQNTTKSMLEDRSLNGANSSLKKSVRRSSTQNLCKSHTLRKSIGKEKQSNCSHVQNIDKTSVNISNLEVLESSNKSFLQNPEASKKSAEKSRTKDVVECDLESSKTRKSHRIDQRYKDDREVIEMQTIPTGQSGSLVSEKTTGNNEIVSSCDHLKEVCGAPAKCGSEQQGNHMFCYKSDFALQVGSTCLKQSNTFAFTLPTKSNSSQALSTSNIQSAKETQREIVDGCMRVQEAPGDNLAQKIGGNASSASFKGDKPIWTPVETEGGEKSPPSVSGCSPSKLSAPNTAVISNETSSAVAGGANSTAKNRNDVIEKPTETSRYLNDEVSSSEEENILLRAQSLKLRENRSNSSRVTKSPKIIDTGPLGGNSQVLERKLRFSCTLQSPSKHITKEAGVKEQQTSKSILSCVRFDRSLNKEYECNDPSEKASNNYSDSSFDVGVYLSRNPSALNKVDDKDDNFQLEIMSTSDDEERVLNKSKKPETSLPKAHGKTKYKRGSTLSSRAKEMRQRKEAQIEALLNSKEKDSDSESPSIVSFSPMDDQGSLKKSDNKSVPTSRVPLRKRTMKNCSKERETSLKTHKSSNENVPEASQPAGDQLASEDLQERIQTVNEDFVQSNSNSDQHEKLENKTVKRNQVLVKSKSNVQKTKRNDTHLLMPNNSNEDEGLSHRYSKRVRRPPPMYWLGRRTQISAMGIESQVLTQNNPKPSQDLNDGGYNNNQRKSKGLKRKVVRSKWQKFSKKIKSSESEHSHKIESEPSYVLENVLVGNVNKDLDCFENEVQEFKGVQGSGIKGDILALGAGAKYDKVFLEQNQVFYVLEGNIDYECAADKTALESGSFFIVPYNTQYIITNTSNSAAKLVVVTCRI